MPTGTEMGDPLLLSHIGTGGQGLYTSASVSHCDVATWEGCVILGEVETAEDDKDVTLQHPSETPKLFLLFSPGDGV